MRSSIVIVCICIVSQLQAIKGGGNPMLCHRSKGARIYKREMKINCTSTQPITPIHLEVKVKKFKEIAVPGHWIGLYRSTCVTHYFFWGSYTREEIMYRILEPCKKSCNLLYPIRKLGAYMIYRSTCIMISLCYIEKNEIARINSILATITFFLKTVSVSDSRKELDPDERTVHLLNYMNGHWLHMIEYRTGEQIAEILRLCERDVCEYLISAVQSHPEDTRDARQDEDSCYFPFFNTL